MMTLRTFHRSLLSALTASLVLVGTLSHALGAQTPPSSGLTLRGLDGREHRVTTSELAAMRRIDTTVTAHHVTGRFGGVRLGDLLAPADFDANYTDRVALLADRKDGAPLAAKDGPFHLIIPGEKRPARWVRQVVRIDVRRVTP